MDMMDDSKLRIMDGEGVNDYSNGNGNMNRERSRSRSRSPRDRRDRRGGDRRGRDRSRERGRERPVNPKRCYVANIPYELRWQDIKDLFREKVGEVTYVELHQTPDGKAMGTGIIEFKDEEIAKKAIETMHKYDLKTRKIIVREEREGDKKRVERQMYNHRGDFGGPMGGGMSGGHMGGGRNMGGGGGHMGGGGMNMGGGNMGGDNLGGGGSLNPQALQNVNMDGPITNQIFIANLDYKVSEAKLREVFRMAGRVKHCELKVDKDGKSRGMGIVEFEHPMESVQAISMFHNQELFDRAMIVRMDKMGGSDGSGSQGLPNRLPSGLKTIGLGLGTHGQPVTNIASINMGTNVGGGGGNMMGNMGGGAGGGGGGGFGNMGGGGMGNMGGGMNNMGVGMGGNMGGGNMGMGGNMGGGMNTIGGGMGSGMGGNMGGGMGNMGGGMGSGYGDSMGGMGGNMGSGMGGSFGNMGGGMGGMGNSGGMGSNMGYGSGVGSGYGNHGSNMVTSTSSRSEIGGVNSVFVRNLPFSYSWQNLKEAFQRVADVKYAAIKMENGKSKGCGMVVFNTSDDARRAVAMMNGVRLDGREVEVRLDRAG